MRQPKHIQQMKGKTMTHSQTLSVRTLCERYGVTFDATQFAPTFDLPSGWVAGWVGPIYVGCSPTGDISS